MRWVRSPELTSPTPDDAGAWFDFIVDQQAATYAGIVPDDFADRQRELRPTWVPELAAAFAEPGNARRVVAKVDGVIVGLASVNDAPAQWEVNAGLVPAPAARELERLYLAAEYHGMGLGSMLLSAVDDGSDLYLWLIDGNAQAQRFYHRRGFVDLPEAFDTSDSWGGVLMHRMVRRSTRPDPAQ